MDEDLDEHAEGDGEAGHEAAPAEGGDAALGGDAAHGAEDALAHAEPHSPLSQFEVKSLIDINVGGLDISFTNSSLWMLIAVCVITLFFFTTTRTQRLIPSRLQALAEMLYGVTANMVKENVGNEGRPFFPFIFSLFMFVLFGNLLGMIPYSFTYTSHIVVTFTMAIVIFLSVTVIGVVRHGFGFSRLFFPHGAPPVTAVILVPIELISYLSRPISLSVRLFANMTVGHVLLKVIAGFVISVGAAAFVVPGIVPFALLVGVMLLEFLVAIIQAYVFAVLSCIYLNEAFHLH